MIMNSNNTTRGWANPAEGYFFYVAFTIVITMAAFGLFREILF